MSNRLAATLGLNDGQLLELSRQGFVSQEMRKGRVVFKLRFRHQGSQRVKSLGSDPAFARTVEDDLMELQELRRGELEAKQFARLATRLLKETKQRALPLLQAHGFVLHGRAIRKSRTKL